MSSVSWSTATEQSAGRLRILTLWWIYRLCGRHVVNVLLWPIFAFIYPFSKPARKALAQYYTIAGVKPRPFRHLLNFAQSLMDKTDACTLQKNPPRFTFKGDAGWDRGAFLISSHLGCIEVLPSYAALPTTEGPTVHAFQELGHNAIFTSIFLRYFQSHHMVLHDTAAIGVETAVSMQEEIRKGNLVLMAGDRLPERGAGAVPPSLVRSFMGRTVRFPKGVFTFARLMEAPVYAITCVKCSPFHYEVHTKRLTGDLVTDFAAFLASEARAYPYQWYHFHDFFQEETK